MDGGATGLLAQHPWVRRRPLDVTEYHRMAAAGILGEDDRVELIEGELILMSPIGNPHAGTVNRLTRLLVRAVGDRAVVSVQNPVRLNNYNEPQPDLTLLRPRPDDYRGAKPVPKDVLLLIEVADTSLNYDRSVKLPLYARHGVPEVWIVDVGAGKIGVWKNPVGDSYTICSDAGAQGTLEPAALPGVVVGVAELLK